MSRLRGARTGSVVVGVVALLGACSGGSAPAPGPAAGVVRPTNAAKAKAALAQSQADLHTLVNGLVESANSGARAPFADCASAEAVAGACSGFDAQASCSTGGGDWPQRWGYNVNLHLVGADAVTSGTTVINALKKSQWVASTRPSSANVLDVSATKGGASVRVFVDDMPGVLNLEAYGPCIAADGTAVKG